MNNKKIEEKMISDVYYQLKTSQTVLIANMFIHMFVLFFWSCCTIIKGFGYYDAVPPASFNAISHTGFWLGIEVFVLFIGVISVLFGLELCEKGIIFGIKRGLLMLRVWSFLLFGAIAANIVHLVAAALELSECKSTLCTLNNGFLVGMLVVLGLVIALEICELYGVYKYKKRMKQSSQLLLIKKNN